MTRVMLRKAFPQDGRIWRLEWLGGLRRNPLVLSEYLIDVALAPLAGNPDPSAVSAVEALKRIRTEGIVRQVGVGSLPNVCIGSLWRNGLRLRAPAYETFDATVDLCPENVQIIHSGKTEAEGKWIIPASRYRLPDGMLGTYCVAIRMGGDPFALLIPCVEVLRGWLLRSTAMSLRLFGGPLHQVKNQIFDPRLSRALSEDRWFVQLRNGLSKTDVWPAALLAHYPYAFKRTTEMFDHVMKEGYERRPRWVRMLPPIAESGRIAARGVIISEIPKRFLVFHLSAIPYPQGPRQLAYELDNDNRSAGIDGTSWESRPTEVRAPLATDVLEHEVEPGFDGGLTVEEYGAPTIVANAKIERAAPKPGGTVGPPVSRLNADPARTHSTGVGTSQETGTARLRIRAADAGQGRVTLPAVGLENAHALMGCLKGFAATKCTAINNGSARPYSVFPTWDAAGKLAWSFIGMSRRRALILEIEHEGLFAYAFEFERRLAKPGQRGERFCLALVSHEALLQITVTTLNDMLRTCAANRGVWPASIQSHVLRTFNHTKDPDGFALAIINELRSRGRKAPLVRDAIADGFRSVA